MFDVADTLCFSLSNPLVLKSHWPAFLVSRAFDERREMLFHNQVPQGRREDTSQYVKMGSSLRSSRMTSGDGVV
jgi:hypothetical protein